MEYAKETLTNTARMMYDCGFSGIAGIETMGKVNQLGTLDEVLELCTLDSRLVPCVDFGHLNSRTLGGTNSREAYAAVIDAIGEALGEERQRSFHIHFSKIEYTGGGEKKHLTFADDVFGPDPSPLMELMQKTGSAPASSSSSTVFTDFYF